MGQEGKRLVVDPAGQVHIESYKVRQPGPGEVLVRVACTQVSAGSELNGIRQRRAASPEERAKNEPRNLGYTAVGHVEAVGEGIEGFEVGDRVLCAGNHGTHWLVTPGEETTHFALPGMYMIDKLLPPVVKGLFAAGLLAAVMSTVEAALNSTAAVTAEDLCRRLWPTLRDRSLVLIGRITAGVVILLAMVWSPYCERFKNIFVVINKVPMMFAPAITTVFVWGVFWKRGTRQAGVATFIAGLAVGLPYFLIDLPHDVPAASVQAAIEAGRVPAENIVGEAVLDYDRIPHGVGIPCMMVVQVAIEAGRVASANITGGTVENYERIAHGVGIPFMMMGVLLLAMCSVVYLVTSLLTPAPTPEELEKMGWRSPIKALTSTRITGITDHRILAIGLLVLMVILYYLFR